MSTSAVIKGKIVPLPTRKANKHFCRSVLAAEKVGDDGIAYENVVVVGDCLDVLKRVPDGAATLVLCSPPYAIPHERVGYDVYRFPGYDKWLADFAVRAKQFYRVLRHGGRFFLNLDLTSDRAAGHASKFPALLDAANAARKADFELLDGFAWYKQKASGDRPGYGTYCSPTLPSIRRVHEPVLLFFKETPHLEGDDALADMLPADFEHATLSTWNYDAGRKCAAEVVLDSFWHIPPAKRLPGGCPVPFPEKLVEQVLLNWTRRNDLVIDPYNGSGTTVAVAQRLGRRFLGIDLSADYCAQARARLDGTLRGDAA